MSELFTSEENDFANRVHIVMQGKGVFPDGHPWAGFTRKESEEFARDGFTPETARASLKSLPVETKTGPKGAVKDTGRLPTDKTSEA